MQFGAAMFFTDYSMPPGELGSILIDRFFAVWEDDDTFLALLRVAMTNDGVAETLRQLGLHLDAHPPGELLGLGQRRIDGLAVGVDQDLVAQDRVTEVAAHGHLATLGIVSQIGQRERPESS